MIEAAWAAQVFLPRTGRSVIEQAHAKLPPRSLVVSDLYVISLPNRIVVTQLSPEQHFSADGSTSLSGSVLVLPLTVTQTKGTLRLRGPGEYALE